MVGVHEQRIAGGQGFDIELRGRGFDVVAGASGVEDQIVVGAAELRLLEHIKGSVGGFFAKHAAKRGGPDHAGLAVGSHEVIDADGEAVGVEADHADAAGQGESETARGCLVARLGLDIEHDDVRRGGGVHVPSLGKIRLAIGSGAGVAEQSSTVAGVVDGRELGLQAAAGGADGVDEIGEAVHEKDVTQWDAGGVGDAGEFSRGGFVVLLLVREAGVGEVVDDLSGNEGAAPVAVIAQTDAFFGDGGDVGLIGVAVGLAQGVGVA